MLPALLALKAIMVLASTGKAIASLVTAITLIQGKNGGGGGFVAGKGKGLLAKLSTIPVLGTAAAVLSMSGDTQQKAPRDVSNINPKTGMPFGFVSSNSPSLVVNVHSADPKAVVDALGKYVKTNGSLPKNLFPGIK
jgi:hypothetical protein